MKLFERIIDLFEKYGFALVLLYCFSLLPPDFSAKVMLMELDLEGVVQSQSGGNLKKQAFWLGLFFVYCVLFVKRSGFYVEKRVFELGLCTLGLVFLCSLTLLWSDYPLQSLKRLIFQVVLIAVVYLSVWFSVKRGGIVGCINFTLAVALLSCLISVALGGAFYGSSFAGWAKTKNSFGGYVLALTCLLYMSTSIFGRARWSVLLMLVLFVLAVMSASKTVIFLLVVAFFLNYLSYNALKLVFFTVVFAVSFLFVLVPGVIYILGGQWDVAMYMSPDAITGRGLIWRTLYDDLYDFERLFIGYGYGAYFGTGVIPFYLDDSSSFLRYLNSAHNSYLELLLQIGVILFFGFMYLLSRAVLLADRKFCFLVASITLVYGVTESALLRDIHIIWVLLIVSLALSASTRQEATVPEGETI